jgi:hypothetical protein
LGCRLRCAFSFALLLAFFAPSDGVAQFFVAARGGVNSMSLVGDRPQDGEYTRRSGSEVAALAGLRVGSGVFVTLGVGYQDRGTGVAYAVRGVDEPVDSLALDFRYATVPVGVRVVTANGHFHVAGTLTTGFLLDASFDDGSGVWEDVGVAMNSVDAMVSFGVGGRIPVFGQTVVLEAVYQQSVVNLTDQTRQPRDWDFPPRFRSRGLSLLAGFELGWGGEG